MKATLSHISLILALFSDGLAAAPFLICNNGALEASYLPDSRTTEVILKDRDLVSAILASEQEQVCAESYYDRSRTICLPKTLSSTVSRLNGTLTVHDLSRWDNGVQVQFQGGQYRPSLSQSDEGWILTLSNFAMVSSKQVLQWDNGSYLFKNCVDTGRFPKTAVRVQVLADRIEKGQLISEPYQGIGVFAGAWQAGVKLGETDAQGALQTSLELGSHYLSVFKMTSSHSAVFTEPQYFDVNSGQENNLTVHVAPTTVRILSRHQTQFGKALYVTGESEYLGGWARAWRMNYRSQDTWELVKNLPIGARFKIIQADWNDFETIYIDPVSAQWERGDDRMITPPYQYYESVIQANPRF